MRSTCPFCGHKWWRMHPRRHKRYDLVCPKCHFSVRKGKLREPAGKELREFEEKIGVV